MLEVKEKQTVDVQRKSMAADITSIAVDLAFLSKGEHLDNLLQSEGLSDSEAKAGLSEEFLRFSSSRMYDQIRLLDETGMEIVRVNFNEGNPSIVPEEKLQNKGKRYYFTGAFALEQGQVFVSPLDLNIERGQIERPVKERTLPGTPTFDNIWVPARGNKYAKPIIRFAAPVFDRAGRKRGVVLVNYSGASLLNKFSEHGDAETSESMLVNAEGYWLHGPSPADEWGFMYKEDGKEKSFGKEYPEEWQQIQSRENGQFETANGMFTFSTVYPLLERQTSSTGSGEAYAASRAKLERKEYRWKVVSHVPPAVLYAKRNLLLGWLSIVSGLLIVVLGAGTWRVAWAGAVRRQAEEELRKSQEQYRALVENIDLGITLISADHKIVVMNSAQGRMFKTEPLECTGLYCYKEFLHRETICPGCPGEKALATGRAAEIETEIVRDDGNTFPACLKAFPVQDSDGTPKAFIKVVEDITEHKRAEAELRAAQKKLVNTARRVGMAETATGVLHNVGNVLNSIHVTASSLEKKVRDSRISYLADVVDLLDEHSGELGTFMTDDKQGKKVPAFLAKLSRELIEEQELCLEAIDALSKHVEHITDIVYLQQSYSKTVGLIEPVSVVKLVEDALRINSAGLERHGVEVKRELAELPPVLLDQHKVLQILTNLISNAKYALSKNGQEHKVITIRVKEPEYRRIRIEVQDNGIGIAEENLTRIFEHGFTTKKDGYGFGLHSAALAANDMKGSISVHSDGPGKGAVFTIELPFQKQEATK